MDDFRKRLLDHYGLTEEEFARLAREPSFSSIPRLDGALSAQVAKTRILQSVEAKEKVLIYGDYDTDGIMATAIMVRCFHYLKKSVSFFIPSRYSDGYGLTMENAKKIAKAGYGLVILVDNGVSCFQEVSYLLSQGVETIIIDHHDIASSVLPPALSTIHPTLVPYGDYPVSAGYLCFLFSCVLLGYKDDYLLTLGALSTISDCMPIHGHNREIVALALRAIRKNEYPEIMMLTDRRLIDESVLSMTVVPVINAVGRIVEDHSLSRVVHYFSELDPKDKPSLAKWMREVNQARKDMTATALERLRPEPDKPAIVVIGYLKVGLNGLLANRLLGTYDKPVAVFSKSPSASDQYTGSLRAKEGCNVMEFIRSIPHLIVQSGGHDYAAGLSIKQSDYPAFKEAFETFAFRHPFVKRQEKLFEIGLSDVTMENYRLLRLLGPFGHDYPEPTFLLRDLRVSALQFGRNGNLKSPLGLDVELFSFSFKKPDVVTFEDTVSLKGAMRLEDYQGKVTLKLRCEEVKE